MNRELEVLMAPAEFAALANRRLTDATCVVLDVLRATSTMVTALANGARAIIPVAEIHEALAIRARQPDVLLAGEREGLRIGTDRTGGVHFDLGNSPREFTSERVRNRVIVMTTTNGTRALRACAPAGEVLVGSFLNLQTVAAYLQRNPPSALLVVGSGTHEQAALEDTLAAGALCEAVWGLYKGGTVADSAQIARQLWRACAGDLLSTMSHSRNGRRLLAHPDLEPDVAFCLQRNRFLLLPKLGPDGAARL